MLNPNVDSAYGPQRDNPKALAERWRAQSFLIPLYDSLFWFSFMSHMQKRYGRAWTGFIACGLALLPARLHNCQKSQIASWILGQKSAALFLIFF